MKKSAFQISELDSVFLSGKNVFCGFSGGADSTCLLLLLREASLRFHFSLTAIHFEHGFRGKESLADAEFCRSFCEKYDVPFRMIPLNVPAHKMAGESDETAARRLRMEQWKKLSAEKTNTVIALGHHADDRVENLFLRLFRGANVSGATSLRIHSEVEGLKIYRPLLIYRKHEIEEKLRSDSISWRIDFTNQESVYRRNFIRNDLLPMISQKFPYADAGLVHSCKVLSMDAAYLEAEAEKWYVPVLEKPSKWLDLPPAMFCRVLKRFLSEKLGCDYFPNGDLIDRFFDFIHNPSAEGGIPLTGKEGLLLTFSPVTGPVVYSETSLPSMEWNWQRETEIHFGCWIIRAEKCAEMPEIKDHFSAVFPAGALPEKLVLRVKRDGDKMIPFGRRTPVSVKKLLSDISSLRGERANHPLLCMGEKILWIPGVRRSAEFPVRDYSNNVLFFSEQI